VALSPGRERSRLTVYIDSFGKYRESGSVVMSVSGSRMRLRWILPGGKTSRTAKISTREVAARLPTITLLEELADRIGSAADITQAGDLGVLADELLARGQWLGQLLAEIPGRKHAAARRGSESKTRLEARPSGADPATAGSCTSEAGGLADESQSFPVGGGRDRPG